MSLSISFDLSTPHLVVGANGRKDPGAGVIGRSSRSATVVLAAPHGAGVRGVPERDGLLLSAAQAALESCVLVADPVPVMAAEPAGQWSPRGECHGRLLLGVSRLGECGPQRPGMGKQLSGVAHLL